MDQYEIHVTMTGERSMIQSLVNSCKGWHFSSIDGDPVLGSGVKHYATTHAFFDQHENQDLEAKKRSLWMRKFMESHDVKVIREKIERIVFDHRTP